MLKPRISPIQWAVAFGALSVPLFLPAFADPPPDAPPGPTLHAETRVVQIDVIVTDSQGKPVANLSKEDFTVLDQGKPRAIDIFGVNRGQAGQSAMPSSSASSPSTPPNVFTNRNSGPPNIPGHSTVIVLDQLNVAYDPGNPPRTPFQTAAGYQMQVTSLMSKISPDERIALYVAAKKLGLVLLQDYTTDRDLLMTRLRNYIPRGMDSIPYSPLVSSRAASLPGSPRRDPNTVPQRETQAQAEDASRDDMLSLRTLAEHLSLVPGRKNVFLVRGPGPPILMHGPWQAAWDKTIAALNEANVAVNTMGELAARTGGQSWHETYDLDAILAAEIEASRTTYTLGFYLADKERDDKFHDLQVQTRASGLQLFYRQGYYAGNTELDPSLTVKKAELESSLLNQVDSKGVGITARVDATPGTPRGKIDIRMNLDPTTLSLKEQGTGWTGRVEETFLELDASGATLSKASDTKEFHVTRESRANFDTQGVAWPQSLPLIPGAVKITIVVRDSKTGKVGSLTVPLM